MGYMANHFEKRVDPGKLVEGAKSVISVLLNYFPATVQEDQDAPRISRYALGLDYHYVIKERLHQLLSYVQSDLGPCEGRAFVDSAPVLDRAWAQNAGLGWIGKNGCLISPEFGSWVFIGELIVDMELAYDDAFTQNRCGTCERCIKSCPTGALISPGKIDARKCISYLTIECRDEIPQSFQGKLENHVFGCDICQEVCPWNRKPIACRIPELSANPELLSLSQQQWMELDKATFRRLFKGSPLQRTGYKGLRKNLDFLNPGN